jgi:hypothetical protein
VSSAPRSVFDIYGPSSSIPDTMSRRARQRKGRNRFVAHGEAVAAPTSRTCFRRGRTGPTRPTCGPRRSSLSSPRWRSTRSPSLPGCSHASKRSDRAPREGEGPGRGRRARTQASGSRRAMARYRRPGMRLAGSRSPAARAAPEGGRSCEVPRAAGPPPGALGQGERADRLPQPPRSSPLSTPPRRSTISSAAETISRGSPDWSCKRRVSAQLAGRSAATSRHRLTPCSRRSAHEATGALPPDPVHHACRSRSDTHRPAPATTR